MDDLEVSKALVEQGTKAIKELTGGAVSEMGKLLGQHVALWRFKNAIDITIRAQGFLNRRGISTGGGLISNDV